MSGRKRLEGWGSAEREAVWWKRGRDPIGRHTLAAAVFGVLVAALVGAAFDPLNLTTKDDLRRAEEAAYEIAYQDVADAGYADGLRHGEVERLGREIVQSGVGAEGPYASHFRDGWREGWNDALEALRAEAERLELPSGYTEFRVLDELPPR